MLSTKVTGLRNAIKTIGAKVSAFRIFYYTEKERALEDYVFVTQLPTLVKGPVSTNSIDTKTAYQIIIIIDETAAFFEQHFATKEKEKNYMLYHLFNEITDVAEIEEIKDNVLKVEAKKQKGDKHSKQNLGCFFLGISLNFHYIILLENNIGWKYGTKNNYYINS